MLGHDVVDRQLSQSVHHATDAEWSVVVRRQMENLAILIPAFFVLLLPLILFCKPELWKWWTIDPATDPVLQAKEGRWGRPL